MNTPASLNAPQAVTGLITDPEVAELETLLQQLLKEHEELLALAAVHREAISTANPHSLGACVQRQNEVLRRVAELEKRRLGLMARLADKMKPLARQHGAGRGTDMLPDRPTVS